MSWLGRGDRRRRGRRPYEPDNPSEPTYIVERDAPPGPPTDPSARWYRRALDILRSPSYDAYPDHEIPWHVIDPPGPVVPVRPIRARLPKPRTHPVSLYVKRYGRLREVKLMGLPLEMALNKLNRRIVAGWVMDEIANTLAQMEDDDVDLEHRRGDDKGQGLAEYALILALIAIIAIAALLILGSEISDMITTLGNCLPDGQC